MKGLTEHDKVDAALHGFPAFECAHLDGYALFPRDLCHSRIWLNRNDIDAFREELFRNDPGTGADIQHRLSAPRQ